MSKYFEMIKEGLEEAIDYERSKKTAASSLKVFVKPVPDYSNMDIKRIRNELRMTQRIFAELLCVSKKTVEAWECGTRKPNGSAKRLMQLLVSNKGMEKQIVEFRK